MWQRNRCTTTMTCHVCTYTFAEYWHPPSNCVQLWYRYHYCTVSFVTHSTGSTTTCAARTRDVETFGIVSYLRITLQTTNVPRFWLPSVVTDAYQNGPSSSSEDETDASDWCQATYRLTHPLFERSAMDLPQRYWTSGYRSVLVWDIDASTGPSLLFATGVKQMEYRSCIILLSNIFNEVTVWSFMSVRSVR